MNVTLKRKHCAEGPCAWCHANVEPCFVKSHATAVRLLRPIPYTALVQATARARKSLYFSTRPTRPGLPEEVTK